MTDEILQFSDPDLPPLRFKLGTSKKVWELPHLGLLPISAKARMSQTSSELKRAKKSGKQTSQALSERAALAMMEVLELGAPGITDHISEHMIEPLFEAWGKHSEITLGESSASATS